MILYKPMKEKIKKKLVKRTKITWREKGQHQPIDVAIIPLAANLIVAATYQLTKRKNAYKELIYYQVLELL